MNEEFKAYIDERFNRLEAVTLINAKENLTAEEAAIYTGYSLKNIYRMTSQREIPHFKRGNKLYFNKAELDRWMTANRIMTESELQSYAATYTSAHRNIGYNLNY